MAIDFRSARQGLGRALPKISLAALWAVRQVGILELMTREGEVVASTVGKYRLRGLHAQGAMGSVYLAEDPILNRQVAIKFMAQGTVEDETRFLQEARVVASLVHPHIVVLLDFGFYKGTPYLVMEYLPGLSLDKWIKDPRTLPEIARVMRGVCLGLRHAHGHGVLHRDIKPSNIIVLPDGEAKLIDFGVARAPESKLTTAGTIMGTPQYLAPEIIHNGEYSPKSDLYSLGVVFYELLVKENPFQANNLAACLHKILSYTPPLLHTLKPEVPVELSLTVAAYMEKDPQRRPGSVEGLLNTLEVLQSSRSSGQAFVETAATTKLETRKKGRRGALWLGLTALLASGVISWVFFRSPRGEKLVNTAWVSPQASPTPAFAPTPFATVPSGERNPGPSEGSGIFPTPFSSSTAFPKASPTATLRRPPQEDRQASRPLPQGGATKRSPEPSPALMENSVPRQAGGVLPTPTPTPVTWPPATAISTRTVPAESLPLPSPVPEPSRTPQRPRLELMAASSLRRGGQGTVRLLGKELEKNGQWLFLRGGKPTTALSVVGFQRLSSETIVLEVAVSEEAPLGVFTLIYQTKDGLRSNGILLEVVL